MPDETENIENSQVPVQIRDCFSWQGKDALTIEVREGIKKMDKNIILAALRKEMGVRRLRYVITQDGETVIKGTGNRQKNRDIDYTLTQQFHKRVIFAGYSPVDDLDYFTI